MAEPTRCLDVDALMTLGNAFGWQVPEGLHHLDRCRTCRDTMKDLALARNLLAEAEPLPVGRGRPEGVVRARTRDSRPLAAPRVAPAI